jgi:hypothetical protein
MFFSYDSLCESRLPEKSLVLSVALAQLVMLAWNSWSVTAVKQFVTISICCTFRYASGTLDKSRGPTRVLTLTLLESLVQACTATEGHASPAIHTRC